MLVFKIYDYYSELDLVSLWSLEWRFCTKGWMLSAGGYCDKGRGPMWGSCIVCCLLIFVKIFLFCNFYVNNYLLWLCDKLMHFWIYVFITWKKLFHFQFQNSKFVICYKKYLVWEFYSFIVPILIIILFSCKACPDASVYLRPIFCFCHNICFLNILWSNKNVLRLSATSLITTENYTLHEMNQWSTTSIF